MHPFLHFYTPRLFLLMTKILSKTKLCIPQSCQLPTRKKRRGVSVKAMHSFNLLLHNIQGQATFVGESVSSVSLKSCTCPPPNSAARRRKRYIVDVELRRMGRKPVRRCTNVKKGEVFWSNDQRASGKIRI